MRALAASLLIVAAIGSSTAQAAPTELYGKSVVVNWSESRSQRAVGMEPAFHPVSLPFTLTVYVSSQGNIFRRVFSVSSNGRASGSQDRTGAAKTGANGGYSVQFSGKTMVVSGANGGFANRITATFDSGLTSCTAQVISAKQSGAKTVMLRSIASGANIEVESVSAGAATCSITQGNALAD